MRANRSGKTPPPPLVWWQGVLVGSPIRCLTRLTLWQEEAAAKAAKVAAKEAQKLERQKRAEKNARMRNRKKKRNPGRASRRPAAAAPSNGEEPLKVGCIVRRPLADGRPYPKELAAQQFNAKHCDLLDNRLQESLGEGVLFLDRVVLQGEALFALLQHMQKSLLPEVYDPEYRPAQQAKKAAVG